MTQTSNDIWTEAMETARKFAEENHIEWYELRGAVIDYNVAQAPELWRDQGIGSSTGNHMIVSAVRGGELEEICRHLVERGRLITDVAAASGKSTAEALASLRAFCAPA